MIDISVWMEEYLRKLRERFGERIFFVGIQGSHSRGEATETSDIDVVVILDELSAADLVTYNAMLDTMPHRELACGFLSGKREIMNWEPSDLFQFYHDTKPVQGSLDGLLTRIDDAAVVRAIKIGACNLFHGCVHNMLYEKSEELLRGLYKGASFVVQAVCFRETGRYIRRQCELIDAVSGDERTIVSVAAALKKGGGVDFVPMSEMLMEWTQKWIEKTR